jgi:myo-inositol-1(or 4)-monophosphatase
VKVDELEHILGVARSAAAEAARVAYRGYRKHPVIERKGAVDLVTRFDRDSEACIRERLGAAFGTAIDLVGEEAGGSWNRDRPTFFIDPIDGTTNFVHGHPCWCVSIGLVVDRQPTLGVIVAPALGVEWFGYVAEDGAQKAMRRSRGYGEDGDAEAPCVPSGVTRFADALLATGFPYDRTTSSDNNFDAFVSIKKRCQAVRRCGSAALDLCLVADGTYDGYWERKLHPWDIAGGIALVRGAGGKVTETDGGSACLESGHVIATNGHIHDALAAELRAVG